MSGRGAGGGVRPDMLMKVLIIVSAVVLAGAVLALKPLSEPAMDVESFSPASGSEGVDVYSTIAINFSLDLDEDSFLEGVSISPGIVGKWTVEGKGARYAVAQRMESWTEYTVALSQRIESANGTMLGGDERLEYTFTTGNSSARKVAEGASVRLDFTVWTKDDVGSWEVYATSVQEVADDDEIYPKSGFFLNLYKEDFTKWRADKLRIIMGKEGAFSEESEHIVGLAIGETTTFELEPDELDDIVDPDLVVELPIFESVPRESFMETYLAEDYFFGNLTPGAPGIHPMWAWPITLTTVQADGVRYTNDPDNGTIHHPYGWGSQVVSVEEDSVTVKHLVNESDLYSIGLIQGFYPQVGYVVVDVDPEGGTVTIDTNWPPGLVGRETKWTLTVYDIKFLSS